MVSGDPKGRKVGDLLPAHARSHTIMFTQFDLYTFGAVSVAVGVLYHVP